MGDERRTIEDIMSDVLAEMPAGPTGGKVGVVLSALGWAAGMDPGESWCAVAATCAVAHGQPSASLQVLVQDDNGEPRMAIFNSTGEVVIADVTAIRREAGPVH